MKKERFLELLNLYLDDELDSSDVEPFFDAINQSEEFRRYYTEYCMISQACAELPVDFPEKRSRLALGQMVYAFGGMAAALALVFLGIQNTIPLFELADPNHQVVPDFAVDASSSPLVLDSPTVEAEIQVVGASRDPAIVLQKTPPNVAVAVAAATPVAVEPDVDSNSWKQGLIVEKTAEGSSLDHELKLVSEPEDSLAIVGESISGGVLDSNRASEMTTPTPNPVPTPSAAAFGASKGNGTTPASLQPADVNFK